MRAFRFAFILLLVVSCCQFLRATDFDDAKEKAEKFSHKYEEVRSLQEHELEVIEKILCFSDGSQDDYDRVSQEAKERLRDDVREQFQDFKEFHDEAVDALAKAEKNPDLKDKQSEINKLTERTEDVWVRVQKIYGDEIRGGNSPVFAFMRKMGQEAHSEYQNHDSKCTAKEVESGNGPADCVWAEKCYVIEIKPNNDRAISKGRGQAKGYAEGLNKNDGDNSYFADLVKKNSDFKSCKGKLEPKVVTYVGCPNIDGTIQDPKEQTYSFGFSSPF
jgi:hypothetical protein